MGTLFASRRESREKKKAADGGEVGRLLQVLPFFHVNIIFTLAAEGPKKLGGPAATAGSACSRSESPTPAPPSRSVASHQDLVLKNEKPFVVLAVFGTLTRPPPASLRALWRSSRAFTRGADATSGFRPRGDTSHRSHLVSAQVMTGNQNKAEMFVRARRRRRRPRP